MMREVMELESDEICKELAITANNLWVILYRARMALRQCLEQNWFADTAPALKSSTHRSIDEPVMRSLGHICPARRRPALLSQAQERPLTAFERWKLRMHLPVCDACTRFEQQIALPARGDAALPDLTARWRAGA